MQCFIRVKRNSDPNQDLHVLSHASLLFELKIYRQNRVFRLNVRFESPFLMILIKNTKIIYDFHIQFFIRITLQKVQIFLKMKCLFELRLDTF